MQCTICIEIELTRSARKHRIGVANVVAAMLDAGEPERVATSNGREELLWIGNDTRGRELEVIGFEGSDRKTVIIHVMPTFYRQRRGQTGA